MEYFAYLLIKLITIVGFISLIIAFYEQTMFGKEWLKEIGKEKRMITIWRHSTTALFSMRLSDRTQRRRRRVAIAYVAAFILIFIQWLLESAFAK